jgi:thiosulfate sulfurtransferase
MPITIDELKRFQRSDEFTLLDVRLREIKSAQPLSIAGATWRDPEDVAAWLPDVPRNQPIIVFCAHGRSISQSIAKTLQDAGLTADYVEGGLAAWIEGGNIVI